MLLGQVLLAASVAALTRGQPQQPFTFNHAHHRHNEEQYEFQWPIKRVAIIGAGVGGLLHYDALTKSGHFDTVRVFERDYIPGGTWHFTEETPRSVPVLNGARDDWWKGDYAPTSPPSGKYPIKVVHDARRNAHKRSAWQREATDFRAPKPVWATLESNAPSPDQQITQFPWPPGQPWASHHSSLTRYLRSFASWLGTNANDNNADFEYNTRVETVSKRFSDEGQHVGWELLLRKLVQVDDGVWEETWWTEDFDAVVVASGRFNVPHIPAIPGLSEWQARFPDRVFHGGQYRRPEVFAGRSVLVVGAGASGSEISRDINSFAAKSFISIRPSHNDRFPWRPLHLTRVPRNTTVLGEIRRFHPIGPHEDIADGKIELVNGTIVTGIDTFIFGTGFRYAFPFLSQYHNTSAPHDRPIEGSEEQPIITDGSHVRSLWLDFLYIDQPTLAFSNLNLGMQSFVWARYTATVLSRVWSNTARLPPRQQLWKDFWATVQKRGGLKSGFQWLIGNENEEYLKFFVGWINSAAVEFGGNQIETPPDRSQEHDLWRRGRYQGPMPHIPSNQVWNESLDDDSYFRAAMDDW